MTGTGKAEEEKGNEEGRGSCDIWRDSPVRYLGYANEIGEAFRPLIGSRLVAATYAVSFAYAAGDTVSKGLGAKACRESGNLAGHDHHPSHGIDPTKYGAVAALDCLAWQLLASIAIPGACVNRIVHVARLATRSVRSKSQLWRRASPLAPTAVGIASIPLIIGPIDQATEIILDQSLRRTYAEGFKDIHTHATESVIAPVAAAAVGASALPTMAAVVPK